MWGRRVISTSDSFNQSISFSDCYTTYLHYVSTIYVIDYSRLWKRTSKKVSEYSSRNVEQEKKKSRELLMFAK